MVWQARCSKAEVLDRTYGMFALFFFQAEDGIRDIGVTGVQTCALPIWNGTWACFYGHASVGCLHVRPALDTSDPEGVSRMRRIAEEVADLVVECGGSISGEHGDGLARSEFLTKMYGPEILRAFAEVKALFDPEGILNPGVIVDPPPMDRQLRIGPGRRRRTVDTGLSFSDQGGFAAAVELCNGSGFCRKKTGGTMCPSYMVTLDEHDTTRARANMLRSVIDGTLPPEELTGEHMKEVMDLCVGCKACKTECPSRVDVASMKTEVLHQMGKRDGFSLRQKAAGHIRLGLALAALTPSLYNAAAGTRLARRAAALAGIDPRRSLPKVTRKTFSKRFPSLPPGEGPTRVALFNDTWNEYQRPDRKSTRLNSSHANISYAVFCLKKKAIHNTPQLHRRQ